MDPRLCVGLGAAVLVVAGSAGAVGAASGALGSNRATYVDEREEDPGAPDIRDVVVSNDDAGLVTFRIDVPTHPLLTQDMRIRVWFSDGVPGTGLTEGGADGFVLVDGFLLGLGNARGYRCQDSTCGSAAGSQGFGFSYAGGARFTLPLEELGVRVEQSTRLDFRVEVGAGFAYDPATRLFDFSNVRRDAAPSPPGAWWRYDVRVGPGRLVVRELAVAPRTARAGRQLTARMHVVRADTGATITRGAVSCAARVGLARLRARSARFESARATCVFRMPPGTAGKRLRGSVSVRLDGLEVTRTFARTIR